MLLNRSGYSGYDCFYRPNFPCWRPLEQQLTMSCELRYSCQRAVVHSLPPTIHLLLFLLFLHYQQPVANCNGKHSGHFQTLHPPQKTPTSVRFQSYRLTLTMEFSHLTGHHTSSALCCVEHIMFCPKNIYIQILYAVRRMQNKTLGFLLSLKKEVSIYFASCDHYMRMFF